MNQKIQLILKAIEAKQGIDPVVLPLPEAGFADTFVICHGESERQVDALAREIEKSLKATLGENPLGVEGLGDKNWILLDYGDIVIHVFLQDVRYRYDLETLWSSMADERPAAGSEHQPDQL